jgi:hypothetical protein
MPDFIDHIRQEVACNNYVISHHARQRKNQRRMTYREITDTILNGEVIEQHPQASPFPKCLFMHPVRPDDPLYVACGYQDTPKRAIIITVHWFDPEKWIDWRTRRTRR